MANLMTAPRMVAVDGDGLVMAGALLYFYITGTSTPKDVYTTAAGGTAFTQPVEADADGLFPAIYLGTGEYKIILKTAAGVTVWTTDPMSGTSATDTLTTRGDLLTRDASGYTRLAIGTSNYVLRSNGLQPEWGRELVPYGLIQGLTYANNVADATNDLDIATGAAMDSSNAKLLVLGGALTKRSDANWAVGTGQGALDTGAVGNNDYYVWLIYRSDTEVVDVLFSLSPTGPTMPANYNYKRLIGWFKRSGGAIVAFTTYEMEGGGLQFLWSAPRSDVALANTLTTARRTDALSVPHDFSVIADIMASAYDASAGGYALVYCPDQADTTPTDPTSSTGIANLSWINTTSVGTSSIRVRTSSAGTVAARSTLATTDVYNVVTNGFFWPRR